MWLSKGFIDLVQVTKDNADNMRTMLAKVTAERDAAKQELLTLRANFQWATTQINDLQYQNKALLEKAYNIRVPVPEIVRPVSNMPTGFNVSDLFEDMGEDAAKMQGMPLYDSKSN